MKLIFYKRQPIHIALQLFSGVASSFVVRIVIVAVFQ